jgi:hypothetical protein
MVSTRMEKPFIKQAQRCAPYNDGHWCFAYDPSHIPKLDEHKAHDALIGFSAGIDAEKRLKQLGETGLAMAWQLEHDGGAVVDVVVGKKLTSGQKAKAQWLKPQGSYLSVPSGHLRIETLNSLSFGPDEKTDEGCEIEIAPGDYDVTLHRINWDLMDGDMDEMTEIPTEVLVLEPVKPRGPKVKNASLLMVDALGDDGLWLKGGKVEGSVFNGTTRKIDWKPNLIYTNLRGAHAEELSLAFGDTLTITAGDNSLSLPCTGYMTRRGMDWYFGNDWYEEHFMEETPLCSFEPWQASTPWILALENTDLQAEIPFTAQVGEPWFFLEPRDHDFEIQHGSITGRIVRVSEKVIILNFGWEEMHKAKIKFSDTLEMRCGRESRTVYLKANPREILEKAQEEYGAASGPTPLLGESMTHWNDPGRSLLYLVALVGDRHAFNEPAGSEIVLGVIDPIR